MCRQQGSASGRRGPALLCHLGVAHAGQAEDTYRRAGRRPTERLVGDLGDVAADRPEDETVARLSLEATVARLWQLLPPDQAEVLLLRAVSGLSVDEVARLTPRRPST